MVQRGNDDEYDHGDEWRLTVLGSWAQPTGEPNTKNPCSSGCGSAATVTFGFSENNYQKLSLRIVAVLSFADEMLTIDFWNAKVWRAELWHNS